MQIEKKRFISAVAVLVGTCIGAGVLGIPYVAAKAGFVAALIYILVIGAIMLLTNLYIGEIALRTKKDHQLPGYAKKYLGKKGGVILEFSTVFGIYAAVIAYMIGIGESLSYLFFKNFNHTLSLGILTGLIMAGLIWRGVKSLKRFEKIGVSIILILLLTIFIIFINNVSLTNLSTFNASFIFLPFGVVLFALMSFHSIPEVEIVLKKNEKLMKKALITGTLISVIFYILFTLVVVGFKGAETPEVATLALGKIFIFLGIFTMFTSYLALGNALQHNFKFDERMRRKKAWMLTALVPIALFILIKLFTAFSFTKILSIGGVISGGLTAILVLLMVKKAKSKGDRKPEYKIPVHWSIVIILGLIFLAGIVIEIVSSF